MKRSNCRGGEPAAETTPSRQKSISPSGGHLRGHFASTRFGWLAWEGESEEQFLFVAEFSNLISALTCQSEGIDLSSTGLGKAYNSDFSITFDGELVLVEGKPEARLQQQKTAARLAAASDVAQAAGKRLKTVSREDLAGSPHLENAKDLLPYRLLPIQPHAAREARETHARQLAAHAPLPLAKATELVGSREAVLEVLAERLLHFDFSRRLNNDTVIYATPLPEQCDAAAILLD